MMHLLRRALCCCAVLLVVMPGALHGQAASSTPRTATEPPPPPGRNAALDSARAIRGETLDVVLLTFGPGNAVFEHFGHNALVIRDAATGQSYAYNWGMFDFDQPNFLGRFLTGEGQYWLAIFRTPDLLAGYQAENRSIRSQRLALTPLQRAALLEFVTWNSQEQNAYYRYDYYRDNCSTRIRDAIDRVLLRQVHAQLDEPGIGRTWRSETERLLSASIPAYAGIQLALGRGADKPLTRWEEGFLPEHLADALAGISVLTEDGRRIRLVTQDSVIFRATRRPMPSEPPQWLSMGFLIGLMLAGLIAMLADSRRKFARVVLAGAVMSWYLVAGIAGTALPLAATVTKHAPYMGENSTLFVINPLALFAAVLVPMALWKKRRSNAALGVAVAIGFLSLIAVALQFVPGFRQHNGLVLAAMVPVQVALAFAVYRLEPANARARGTYDG